MKAFFLAAAVLAVSGVAAAAQDIDLAAGEKVFKKCRACHAVGADAKNKVGPTLNGVVGRAWGAVEGFKYSKGRDGTLVQMAEADGRVWDIASLDAYLKKPKDVIPKGRMAFAGLRKDDDRAAVIAYLASFAEDGSEVDPAPVLNAAGATN